VTSLDGGLTTLHSFVGADGDFPKGALIQGTDGKIYGVTPSGGNGDGTVFNMTTAGALTTLHLFDGTDGNGPAGGLLQATNGNFYGTTAGGGAHSDGTVFSLSMGLGQCVTAVPAIGAAATSGKPGSDVIILGTNLTGATSVTFNYGDAAVFTIVSATEITTTVPAGAKSGYIQVTTPGGTLTTNSPFSVVPAPK